jgi:hypothetical protein
MLRLLLPLSLILQGFCLWHAYRNNADQKWYWIIVFIPFAGCGLYLYDAFYSRRNVETVAESLKQVVNSNYKIEKLEKEVKFNSSFKNKVNLADAYTEIGRYREAIALYEDCREGYMADDEPLARKLLESLFLDKQYDRCIGIGKLLADSRSFANSDERVSLAWALHYQGMSEQSHRHFTEMDKSYSNYDQRFAFCRFLIETGKPEEARQKTETLMAEFNTMKSTERRVNRLVIDNIRDLVRQMDSAKGAVS